jgi:hypothetical protein
VAAGCLERGVPCGGNWRSLLLGDVGVGHGGAQQSVG